MILWDIKTQDVILMFQRAAKTDGITVLKVYKDEICEEQDNWEPNTLTMSDADKKDPDMEGLKQAFALFDRDRDGEINQAELAKVETINSLFIH